MKKYIFISCLIFLISIPLVAQDFSYFSKRIDVGSLPYNPSLVYTTEDGYVTISYFEIANVKALMWIKFDRTGKNIDSGALDHGFISDVLLTGDLLTQGSDQQFYAAYSKHKEGNKDDLDIAWVSFSGAGDVLYKKEYKGDAVETPTFLKVLDNGDLLIGGTQESDSDLKYIVLRANERGEVLWKRTFGDNVVGLPSLAVQGDNILLLGSTQTANKGRDMLLISIDGTEAIVNWSKTYGSDKDETASQIGVFSENSFLLAGLVEEDNGQKQYYIKVDDKGVVELENTYYTAGIGELKTQLLPVLEGEGFIGVSNFKNDEDFQQPLIMRIDDKAEVLWTISSLTPNANADVIVKDIELEANQNGYVVTGYNTDAALPYGWIASFDYTGVHCASLGCDSTDVVTSIKDINKKPTIEIYPNPVHSGINISYNFPEVVEVNPTFQLYSLKGEEVVNVQLDASKKSMRIDTSELPSGIYFYKTTYRGINVGIGKLAIK